MNGLVVKEVTYQDVKQFVLTEHYLKRRPHILVSFALYDDSDIVGIATFGFPPSPNVQRLCGEQYRKNVLEFNRLWVSDSLGKNSESYFIGQCFKQLRVNYPQYYILVSYADTSVGHIGYVYQATNWIYTGLSSKGGAQNIKVGNKILSQRGKVHRGYIENVEKYPRTLKHRYVYFLKNKKQLLTKLKYNVLSYPKS